MGASEVDDMMTENVDVRKKRVLIILCEKCGDESYSILYSRKM